MHVQAMISTHPHVKGSTNETLIRCIEECFDCAQSCIACADACLGEEQVFELTQCIRTGSNEGVIRIALEACAMACRVCGQECESHAEMHEHCRICAENCKRCEAACREASGSIH